MTSGRERDPGLPFFLRATNLLAGPLVKSLLPLDPDQLVAAAQRRTKLTDFGDDEFRQPLEVLTSALLREARLHALGRLTARRQLVEILAIRLRLQALLQRHPEIADEAVARPIFILGMPGTGATFLQRILARDAGLRSLPYWEALNPLPFGPLRAPIPTPDPRIRFADQSLAFPNQAAPRLRALHERIATEPDEDGWLLALDLRTMLFESSFRIPSFRDWYETADHARTYAFLRRMLRVLQWYRRGERWLLESPQHLGQLRALLAEFPDATIVQTHRDPVVVTGSFASFAAYGARMSTKRVEPVELGNYWAARIEGLLRRNVADRAADDPRFVDVHFHELQADPIAVVRRVYQRAGRDLASDAEVAMRTHVLASPRHEHGHHDYRLEDYGLDAAERRRALAFYSDRFGVPIE